jgi:hypothetical protein
VDIPFEEGVIFLDIPVDCRGDASLLLVCIPTDDDPPGGFRHHVLKTLKVTFGDDACVPVGRKGVIEMEFHSCLLDRFYEVILS